VPQSDTNQYGFCSRGIKLDSDSGPAASRLGHENLQQPYIFSARFSTVSAVQAAIGNCVHCSVSEAINMFVTYETCWPVTVAIGVQVFKRSYSDVTTDANSAFLVNGLGKIGDKSIFRRGHASLNG
jgi:hypothetical protein